MENKNDDTDDEIKQFLRNIIPDSEGKPEDSTVMDTGILDEEDNYEGGCSNDSQEGNSRKAYVDEDEKFLQPLTVPPPAPPPPPPPQSCSVGAPQTGQHSRKMGGTDPKQPDIVVEPIAVVSNAVAPTSHCEPSNAKIKDLYSLNKIARAKKNQVPILGGGVAWL